MKEKIESPCQHGYSMPIIVLVLCTFMIMIGPPAQVFAPPAPPSQGPDQSMSASVASPSSSPTGEQAADFPASNATDNMVEDFGTPPPSMATADSSLLPEDQRHDTSKDAVQNIRVDD
jgi:hypothetical protein